MASLPDGPQKYGKVDVELNTPDTLDGFRKHVKTKITSLLCGISKNDEERSARGGGDISPSPSSTASTDFTEARTAFVQQESQGRGAGGDVEIDSDVYDFSYPKRGLAVIINNEEFASSSDFDDRPGSSYDASALYHSFRHLGFDVMLYQNLSAWKMVEVLRAASREYDHQNADCFACSILTHGDQTWSDREYDRRGMKVRQDLLFGTDGKAVSTATVVDLFSDRACPRLKRKPRLFFLQACRGNKLDEGQDMHVVTPIPPGIKRSGGRDATDSSKGSQPQPSESSSGSCIKPPSPQRQTSLSSSVDPPGYPANADRVDAKPGPEDAEELQGGSYDHQTGKSGGESDGQSQVDAHGDLHSPEGASSVDMAGGLPWKKTKDVPVSPAPLYKDCLIMYATPPGHFAWRRKNGAWFIQSLCKVLDHRMLGSLSLVRALIQVSGHVARNYQSENPSRPSMHHKKEMPVMESMLVKDIYMKKKSKA